MARRHAHVTMQWRGKPAETLATVTAVSGKGAMLDTLPLFESCVATLRDVVGCTPRDPSNGPRHRRQILDSETDGWVQADLFVCEADDCALRGADVPAIVNR